MIQYLPTEERARPFLRRMILLWDKSPWIVNACAGVLALLVGAASALPQMFKDPFLTIVWAALILIAIVLLVMGPLFSARRAARTLDLEEQIQDLERAATDRQEALAVKTRDLRAVIREAGSELLAQCELSCEDTRLSVYQWHSANRVFVLVGRVSTNPTLTLPGRPEYPDGMGLIAQAWERGRAFHREWATDPTRWVASQVQKFGVPSATAEQMKMRSRSFLGVRVDDGGIPVGVLMLESTDLNRVTAAHEDTIQSHPAFVRLQALLRAAPRTPKLELDTPG